MPSPGSYNNQVLSPYAQISSDLLSGLHRPRRTNVPAIPHPPWKFFGYPVVEGTIEYVSTTIDEHFVVILADGLVGHFLSPKFTHDVGRVDDISQAENDRWRIIQLLDHLQSGKKFAVGSSGNMIDKKKIGFE